MLQAKLDMVLTDRTLQLLDEYRTHMPLHQLNLLLRSYISRKGTPDSVILQKIIEKYKKYIIYFFINFYFLLSLLYIYLLLI